MAAPEWMVRAGDGEAVLLCLPALWLTSHVVGRFVDAPSDEQKARVLVGVGASMLAFTLLFSGVCDGDRRGLCRFSQEIRW
jgi:hypothetical protein